MARPSRLVDVSVPLVEGMLTYPGNPEFRFEPVKRIAEGGSSNVSRLSMGTHAGTHVDAPRHFFDDGRGVQELPLELLVGPARVLAFEGGGGIGRTDLERELVDGDVRVLLRTTNSALWSRAEFDRRYAYLAADGAEYLVERGVGLVGIDYLSIEQFKKPGAPAHRVLLSAGVVIVEGLNLSAIPPGRCEMYCLPLPVGGADGAPARVVLRIE